MHLPPLGMLHLYKRPDMRTQFLSPLFGVLLNFCPRANSFFFPFFNVNQTGKVAVYTQG